MDWEDWEASKLTIEHLDSRVYDPTLDAYGSGSIPKSQQIRTVAMV